MLFRSWTEEWAKPDAPKPLGSPYQMLLSSEYIQASNDWQRKDLMTEAAGQGIGFVTSMKPARQMVTDMVEEALGTDPDRRDTDEDGIPDGDEDTDGDGLTDGDEVNTHATNPQLPDTDGDGLSDGDEVAQGTDPLDPNDPPPAVPVLSLFGRLLAVAGLLLLGAYRLRRGCPSPAAM